MKIVNYSDKMSKLRCKLREVLCNAQHIHRSAVHDKNRIIESEILTENDVLGMCKRIKRRKHADEEDLIKLSTAFYQSEANISAFIKTTGALNILLKEFIGQSDRKIYAAQAILNLSLSNDSCCSKIAVYAGVYLMIYLRNITCMSLNKICIWTLQNMVSCNGHKSLDILMSQELVQNTFYVLNNSGDEELQHESMILLDIIVEKKYSAMNMDEKEEVTKNVLDYITNHSCDYIGLQCLQRILTLDAWSVDRQSTTKLINVLAENIKKVSTTDHRSFYFSIKILFTIFKADSLYMALFLQSLMSSNLKLSIIFSDAVKIINFVGLAKDMLRFLALIVENPMALDYLAYDDVVSNLQIPKFFEF